MSVCMVIGVRWSGVRQRFRLAWHMGLFQFIMPIIGWAIGKQLADLLRSVGSYLGAALVFAIGVKMLIEAIKATPGAVEHRTEQLAERAVHLKRRDPTQGWSLIFLSVATSLDALVVGFSLGLKGQQIWAASVMIGITAALMALIGVAIGRRAGVAFGKFAEIAGALMLMALGVSFCWL